MARPCFCDNLIYGAPWVSGVHCRLCWLYHNDKTYRTLWDDHSISLTTAGLGCHNKFRLEKSFMISVTNAGSCEILKEAWAIVVKTEDPNHWQGPSTIGYIWNLYFNNKIMTLDLTYANCAYDGSINLSSLPLNIILSSVGGFNCCDNTIVVTVS